MGSEENQFTPLGVGVNKLIFKQSKNIICVIPDSQFIFNLNKHAKILKFPEQVMIML
jgi:hypothetical protein